VSLPKDPPPLVYVRPPQLSYQILSDTSQCTNWVQPSVHLCNSVNHSTLIGHKRVSQYYIRYICLVHTSCNTYRPLISFLYISCMCTSTFAHLHNLFTQIEC
jgi:hypothetical protein